MKIVHSFNKKITTFKKWLLQASWKKKIAVTALVIAVLFLVSSPLRKKTPLYTTEPVTHDNVSDIISESGNITSSGRFDVYSTSTGYIEEIFAQNGDVVDQGEKLFKVKSTANEQEKAAAYASYMSALALKNTAEQNKPLFQSQLETARKNVIDTSNAVNVMNDNRNNSRSNPVTGKTYTQEEIDSINSALVSARQSFTSNEKKYLDADTSILSAKAGLASAWLAYQATQNSIVIAPAPGIIANFSSTVGDKVVALSALATTTTSGTPTLVILGELAKTAIKIPLNEVDVNKVKEGQIATIIFDAFRGKKYTGHVVTVDAAGTNTNGVITYNALVVIDNPDHNIKTEMTATISIETQKHQNVLTVPNTAVKPYKGGKAVIVVGENKDYQVKNKAGKKLPFYYVPVRIGLKGITRTEIIEGVTDGMQVVTSSIN